MTSRLSAIRRMLPDFESALHSFTTGPSKFRIVHTVNPTRVLPKTLYILDSSFNPPSIAHLALATSALRQSARSDGTPHRLLLLFSTHNADKAPSPASFEQRIALMTVFAEDLDKELQSKREEEERADAESVTIDIGLTKEPYYTDKSSAIASTSPNPYPSAPTHVHLVGYDTLIRFCNPKYYPDHTPPLAALSPFFAAGHKLRVTQRPSVPSDAASAQFGSAGEQARYVQRLRDGGAEKDGFERAWAERIEVVVQPDEGLGVSSTRVRGKAAERDWEGVGELCTVGVAAWMREEGLYGGR
ncbi:hypothetical protein BDV95DRAFT_628307 [Massariosphaeria phaeospora]|uniref:Nicotinamide-nucleotide adenylyltransferase n=1 Tax=Massariosphaeria phaeospora TaxID=100035 RepID=A0A7C8I7R1_9PLEO|nr:hypothetical protein BDV95DRAFT_628307 [Massariosphaeria phaeospora]